MLLILRDIIIRDKLLNNNQCSNPKFAITIYWQGHIDRETGCLKVFEKLRIIVHKRVRGYVYYMKKRKITTEIKQGSI